MSSDAPPSRLSPRSRRWWLVVHIAAGGAWLGIDVVLAVFVATALTAGSTSTKILVYRAIELMAVWPLLAVGLLSLTSGVVLSWWSKWGLVRYWWVSVKLALNIVLTALVPLALRPAVGDAVDRAQRFSSTGAGDLAVGHLVFPPVVSPAALLVAVALSVFKPWGQIRRPAA